MDQQGLTKGLRSKRQIWNSLRWPIYIINSVELITPNYFENSIIGLAHHRVSVAQWKNIGARNPKLWGSIPRGDLEFYLGPALVTRRKTSFFISLPSSKLTISLFLFTTKWSCYTSPPTQHHSFFRNLPLSIILDSWNVKLKLAIHNFSTKLICGTRIFQINVDLLNMYLCCVIVMIS